jgi:large subunit ribosomal protein L28
MSRICAVCGKRPQVANNVSHANNRTKKWVYPNVHKMRFTLVASSDKHVHSGKVCTKCVKAQKIQKVI